MMRDWLALEAIGFTFNSFEWNVVSLYIYIITHQIFYSFLWNKPSSLMNHIWMNYLPQPTTFQLLGLPTQTDCQMKRKRKNNPKQFSMTKKSKKLLGWHIHFFLINYAFGPPYLGWMFNKSLNFKKLKFVPYFFATILIWPSPWS